jgi:hypothetical protein
MVLLVVVVVVEWLLNLYENLLDDSDCYWMVLVVMRMLLSF